MSAKSQKNLKRQKQIKQLSDIAATCVATDFCTFLDHSTLKDKFEMAQFGCLASKDHAPSLQDHHKFCVDVMLHYKDLPHFHVSVWFAELAISTRDDYFFEASKKHQENLPTLNSLDAWAGQDPEVLQLLLDIAPDAPFVWEQWPNISAHLQKQALLSEVRPSGVGASKKM